MLNKVTRILLMVAFLLGAPLLHAQSSNKVWFAIWNGEPTPSSDVAVQNLTTGGSASLITNATSFVSQTNFPSFNSPYDLAVDPAMGKVYVLDAPQYIYSFNLVGTPAQIAASAQIIYTTTIPQADINSSTHPVISGIALDPTNHYLYFNQFDGTTTSNSFIGRLSLTTSSASDASSPNGGSPALQTFYVGNIPGVGPIAIDSTNVYLGAYNTLNGNNGVYAALLTGGGAFTSLVTISASDTTFANGLISGVASSSQSNLVYYLTSNAGPINHNYSLSQNAIWTYNTVTHAKTQIASGYSGYPDNIALDPANKRYYFTVGQDGTGNISPADYQAIYTGSIGLSTAPTTLFVPALSGQDGTGGPNAGGVSLQGIFVQDIPNTSLPPVAGAITVNAQKNITLDLPVASLVTYDSDPNGGTLSITGVNGSSTNGGSVSLSGNYVIYTPVSNFTGTDRLTYTLADSEGGQAQGAVNVNVLLSTNIPSQNHLSLTFGIHDRFLLFAGAVSQGYVFQYAASPLGPWIDFSPDIVTGTSGIIEYNDLVSYLSGSRLYRVRTGP